MRVRQPTTNPRFGLSFFHWILLLLLWQCCFFSAAVLAGSPFYLTAERSFSNTEAPTLRLDYTDIDPPMLLRVLKPTHLDNFLDGQFNISRSYEQPISELNPGHYFARGLNAAESPLRLFRGMMASDFRKSLKGTAFNHALLNVTQKPLVAVPQQVLVAPPSGFQILKEEFLDLKHNKGKDTHDLTWWFGQDYYLSSEYKIRPIQLPPLPDGIYLVQAVQGKSEAQCLVQVSSLSVQVKQSSEQLLVRIMDRGLHPVADAKVSYRDGRGAWQVLQGTSNTAGEVAFNNPDGNLDGKLLIKADAPPASTGGSVRTALTSTDFLPAQAKGNTVFIMTDRPIFKPGETFFYKGIIRTLQDGHLQIPPLPSRQSQVSLLRADGNATGLQGDSTISDFGSFSGSFYLDPGQTPGLYRLLAQIDQQAYAGEFRVRDYVKPTYYLEWLERSPSIVPGQTFKLKFRAKRYSGGVPQNVKFEVFLYRKKFETPQFVEEAGEGLSAGSDYTGQVKSAAPLSQPQRLFSSIEARQAAELSNPWENAAQLDDNGDGSFEFTVPANADNKPDQEWVYSLMVRAQDNSGGLAVLTENIYATLSEAQPVLGFNKTIAAVGEANLQLLVQSNYADGKPAANAGGVIDVTLEQPGSGKRDMLKLPFTTDSQGRQQLPIPALQTLGRLSAVAKLETLDGHALSHPSSSQVATVIVAGNGGEAVVDKQELALYTSSTILSPGEQAKVFALLPKGWGNQESGTIWETVAGGRIFDSRGSPTKGSSHWFEITAKPEYGTGFYHTVTVPVAGGKYAEQTLGFRIVPKDKRLHITILPEKAETEPLKPTRITLEVKRADGTPATDTELAMSIVDRAVYAVQAEFRPGIFDFFYPLQRSNVSTFYSDELQGYGYADLLRKPNFALSALKSQSKLAKKAMRDTADWLPHLLTDAQGRVSIDVDMPANITEWLVTAVANDKDGRIGEATGQFRTVTDVAVEMVGPQFMRDGDEMEVAVKLINQLAYPVTISGNITLPDSLQLLNGETSRQIELAANSEQLWPLRLRASGQTGSAAIQISLRAPDKIRVGGTEEFDIPLKPAALAQVYNSKANVNLLHTDIPATAQIRQLDVRVNSGLLGAALQAAVMLVEYPYGCTEQLAHSTAPNLVLMDLIGRAGFKPEELGPLAEVLNRARQNAALGIRKLRGNQKANGGFSLWPNESEASLPVTQIAMQALKYAQELKVEGASKAYSKAQEWLSGQSGTSQATDGFTLAGFTQFETWSTPWERQADFVSQLVANPQASADDLVSALRILHYYQAMPYHSFNQRFPNLEQVRKDLLGRLQQALGQLDPAVYQAQPNPQLGFAMGLPSLVSAGLGVLDEAQALPQQLADKLKLILLDSQKNGYWTSTYDTAQVIYNSRNLLSKEAAAARDGKSPAHVIKALDKNGKVLGKLSAIPGGYMGSFTQFTKQTDLSDIRLAELNIDETASANIHADVPYPMVAAKADGLQIERRYRRIIANGNSPLNMAQTLKIGDLVISEVHVKRIGDTKITGSDFVVIEDGIPALAEGMENDQTYLADAKAQVKEGSYWGNIKETQRYPDHIVRVAKLLSGEELSLFQVWRVTRPGKVAVAPAVAFDMYNEAIQGNSTAEKVSAEK